MRLRPLAALLFLALPLAAQSTLHLIPMPRELKPGSALPLTSGIQINCAQPCDPEDAFAVAELKQTLTDRHILVTDAASAPHIFITRFNTPLGAAIYKESTGNKSTTMPSEMQPEGYSITPDRNNGQDAGIALTATTSTGIFYALQTAKQLIVGDGATAQLQIATIRDWPAMKYRGVHDDLSRGPIPTLAFQQNLIRTLAGYKVNTYSPYFEHTQQYASAPLFAPPGGSLSAADARALVAYAAQYHVTIIPEQEAFGHLHHNLTWEVYQSLAETPHGDVLAPGQPGSLQLIHQMFTELAALYPGPFLHIGADETQNLGLGQTKSAVDTRGLGPVYLDFMQQIVTDLAPLHRRILFWGDIAQTIVQGGTPYGVAGPDRIDPHILEHLPATFKQSTIAVAWQYDPQPKGFAKFLTPFTTAGFETWVAPGVNNWGRVWPDDNDALPNIQQFIAEGQRQHSTGTLNTIWYDDGEALANNNWYGLLFGAAASWQSGVSSVEDFQQSFGPVFHGDATGALNRAQIELMTCHQILRKQARVGDGSDGLFWMDPWSKDGQIRAAKLRPFSHDLRLHAEAALALIAQARAAYPNPSGLSTIGYPGPLGSGLISPLNKNGEGLSPPLDPRYMLPSNPTTLHNPDAIDALELGARRLDFIGLKFQLADELAQDYTQALLDQASTDKKLHSQVSTQLNDISSFVGRIRDIRDTYGLLRDLYAQAWLRSNRPYGLTPNLARYDDAMSLWLSRADTVRTIQRQYSDGKPLPSAADAGIPPSPSK